ncbi:MAG: hypothetical protein QF384_11675 [Alphaproteobacteria bacterium]|jgi:hypothetical protein|nr:hypothetical protein [Alphaproteobacteria bacterium]MDP6830638.1 hypothetical protein [Alphaproteobacteria bacterium]MDP6875432.1 hypothetical protein [Alphaproteobacteria bacterium]
MLDDTGPAPSERSAAAAMHDPIPEELLQLAITQFALRLRRAGYAESAHFMDVAALVLKEQRDARRSLH